MRNRNIDTMWKVVLLLICLCASMALAGEVTPSSERVGFAASSSDHELTAEVDTVESLSTDLQKGDSRTRMNAVRKLGSLVDPASKQVLLDRLKQLPQPAPSSDSNQAEKIAVLRGVLPKLPISERTVLLVNTIREEVAAMRAAKQIDSDKYYPKDLAYAALTSLGDGGLSGEIREELARLSSDDSIPNDAREQILVVVLRDDLDKEGSTTSEEKVRSTISKLGVRPVAPIPWSIYNDAEKRIAYAKTEDFGKQQKQMGVWLKSDEAVRVSAYEHLLHFFGLTAIEQLVATLDQKSISKDRRDYLALLATAIVRTQSPEIPGLQEKVALLVGALTKYVEEMEDLGAFSRRAVAAGNLNTFFEKAKLKKRISIGPVGTMTTPGTQHP